MDEKIKYAVAGLVLGGVLVWLITSIVTNTNNSSMMGNRSSAQSMMQNSDGIDAHFIEQMIPHHEDAITMAEIALEKAQHSEIKTLAQNIIKTQTAENDQMKTWYKDWFGTEVPENTAVMGMHGMGRGGMHMGMMGDETDMEALENASEFDKEFIEQMIPHHQMAIMMANMLKNGTQRSEMKQLADNIITAQAKEINDMRQWYKEW